MIFCTACGDGTFCFTYANFATLTRYSIHAAGLKGLRRIFGRGHYGGYGTKRLKHHANIMFVKYSTYTIRDTLYIEQDGDCNGLFLFWAGGFGLKGSFNNGFVLWLFVVIADADWGNLSELCLLGFGIGKRDGTSNERIDNWWSLRRMMMGQSIDVPIRMNRLSIHQVKYTIDWETLY